MPEKETSQNAADTPIDLRALELEIDREIDAKLAPSGQEARSTADGGEITKEDLNSFPIEPDGEDWGPDDSQGFSIDFQDRGVETEKEADNLFIPAAQFQKESPIRVGSGRRQQKTLTLNPSADEKGNVHAQRQNRSTHFSQTTASNEGLSDFQIEIEKEIDNLFVPATEYPETGPVKTSNKKRPHKMQGMFPAADEKGIAPPSKKARTPTGPAPVEASTEGLGDFQIEVEKEIDHLFVPAAQFESKKSVKTGQKEFTPAALSAKDEKESITAQESELTPRPSRAAAPTEKLDDIQIELEKEIDNLFVPAEQYRNKGPVESAIEESCPAAEEVSTAPDRRESLTNKMPDTRKAGPAPLAPAMTGSLEGIQLEIEKEIDDLFVPADQYRKGAAKTGDEGPTPAVRGTSPTSERRQDVPVRRKPAPSPQPAQASSNKKHDAPSTGLHPNELTELIEKFRAAYLSFDWELSRENTRNLLTALNELEPLALRTAGTKSVFKLMEVILKRLLDRPHAVNSILVRLIRDSHSLLADMLLHGETGPAEKQKLKELFDRFNELRQRALAAKTGAGRQDLDTRPSAAATVRADEIHPASETSHVTMSATEAAFIVEFKDWMKNILCSLSENLKVFESEIARFPQIENSFAKAVDFASIGQKLNGFGNSLEAQADFLRDKRAELIEWTLRISKLQNSHSNTNTPEQVAETAGGSGTTPKASVNVYNESLYLIASNGKCLALPTGCVLKVARVSRKGKGKILERGYATLEDFSSPLFRWIKSGVFGKWAKKPRKELDSYRFEHVEPALFECSGKYGRMAILASDGKEHAVIFADSADLISDPQMAAVNSDDGVGAYETLRAIFPLAFDPGNPLALLDQISGTTRAKGPGGGD